MSAVGLMSETPKKVEAVTQPPTSAINTSAPESTDDRLVTQKHYETAKKELRELIARKKQADKDLAQLEAQIYKLEGNYLEDTQQGGNIVRGFDGYLKGMINTRKSTFAESDRLFSLSSVSYSETAQPEKVVEKNKKRRKTIDAGSDSDDGSVVQYSGNTKRARVSYAD